MKRSDFLCAMTRHMSSGSPDIEIGVWILMSHNPSTAPWYNASHPRTLRIWVYIDCRIKTGHPFLVEVSARRWGRWQSLGDSRVVTAKCVETTSESHVHLAKHSPGEMRMRPSIAKKKHDDQKSNCCNEFSHLYRSIHNGMKVSIMPLKTAIAHIGWAAVSVWMSFASSPSIYVSSFSPTGHPVNSVMILLQVPMWAGQQLAPSVSFTTRTSSSTSSNSKPVKTAVTAS